MLKSAAAMTAPRATAVSPAAQGYQLADLQVDPCTRRVLRNGLDLEVTSLSFDLLMALVRAAPGLVTFDTLMEQVWPGLVVSPETLTQRVRLLRQSLGDSADSPKYILAVRGHGYRLVATVVPLAVLPTALGAPVRKLRRPWPVVWLAVLLVMAGLAAASWLRAQLPGESRASYTDEAYQFLLQAESVVNGTAQGFRAAIALHTDALDRDPGLGRAYSGRAMNRAALVWSGSVLARGLEDAEADARKALQIDDSDPVAHSAMASIHALRGDWAAAGKSFIAAMKASPSDAEVRGRYAVTFLLFTGQLRAAMAEATAAQQVAPDEGFAAAALALIKHASGADEQAVRMADLAVSRGADPGHLSHVHLSFLTRSGRFTEAAELAVDMLPPALLDAGGAAAIRQAYKALEDPSQRLTALAALRKLTGRPAWEQAEPRSRQPLIDLLASLGGMDELYHEMNRMLIRGNDAYPQIIAIGMMWTPQMRAFRQDDRFQQLTQSLGLMDYWKESGPPDGCGWADSKLVCR